MRRGHGFTVVELLIALSVIGVLASLAVPAYYQLLAKAHRAEAQGLLSELYGMENAFFAEHQRFGCLDEVGFQLEGKGHFAVWICDDGSGCVVTPDGGVRCPCFEAPDDWTGAGGDPFVRRDPGAPEVRYAWAPIPRPGPGGVLAAGPPMWITVPLFAAGAVGADDDDNWPMNPSDPGGLTPPIDLPADCDEVMRRPIFTAGADNWCRRAIPDVVDVFWVLSNEGKRVNGESYPETSGDESVCHDEPAPGGGGGPVAPAP